MTVFFLSPCNNIQFHTPAELSPAELTVFTSLENQTFAILAIMHVLSVAGVSVDEPKAREEEKVGPSFFAPHL